METQGKKQLKNENQSQSNKKTKATIAPPTEAETVEQLIQGYDRIKAELGEGAGEIDRGRGLSNAAFLIRNRNYLHRLGWVGCPSADLWRIPQAGENSEPEKEKAPSFLFSSAGSGVGKPAILPRFEHGPGSLPWIEGRRGAHKFAGRPRWAPRPEWGQNA